MEIEAERAAKRRNLMEMVAQLRESHAAAESQSQAIDLTKVAQTYTQLINVIDMIFNLKEYKQSFLKPTSSLYFQMILQSVMWLENFKYT